MKIPKLLPLARERSTVDTFRGLNHGARIESGEFSDMKNLTSDFFPILRPRKPRHIYFYQPLLRPTGMLWMNDCLWCTEGDELCRYDGTELTRYAVGELSAGRKRLISFGAYILILPDKKYLNTADPTEFGDIDAFFAVEDTDLLSFSVCDDLGNSLTVTASETAPEDPDDGVVWMKTLDPSATEYYKYSAFDSSWLPMTCCLKITASVTVNGEHREVSDVFSAGDSVKILFNDDREMFSDRKYPIRRSEDGYILIPTDGVRLQSGSFAPERKQTVISRTMPALDFLFEHDNRLWGCCWYVDEETHRTVNEIHASKLGDFKNWDSHEGISTDSYTISCGSDGKWTGAAEVGGYPCFFKERYLHKVYGTLPSNYSCDPTEIPGVQEGCADSLAAVGGVLYYKSRFGVMRYDGALPVPVSDKLGALPCSEAIGAGYNKKYYLCLKNGESERMLYVYDTEHRLWHREDDLDPVQLLSTPAGLLYQDSHPGICAIAGGQEGTLEQPGDIPWYAVTGLLGEALPGGTALPEQKYYPQIIVRMFLQPGARVHFYVQYDSCGQWEKIGSVIGKSLRSVTLPLRLRRCDHLQLKIEGTGEAAIYSLTYLTEKGSVYP